jgi:hypothetical protein
VKRLALVVVLTSCSTRRAEPAATSASSPAAIATIATSSRPTPSSTSAPSASALSVDDLPSLRTVDVKLSFAVFDPQTTHLLMCVEVNGTAREDRVTEAEAWDGFPKATKLRESCSKAFQDRKVKATCEIDREAWIKGRTLDPMAALRFVSLVMNIYADSTDADLKWCLDHGGRWRVTPP